MTVSKMRTKREQIHFSVPKLRLGLTLLEVILSLAILGVSMAAISQLFFLGYRGAAQATLRNEANILCDTKMAELAAGIIEPQSVGRAAIIEAPGWIYSIQIDDGAQPDLLVATVTVQTNDASQTPIAMSITRFIPNPNAEAEE